MEKVFAEAWFGLGRCKVFLAVTQVHHLTPACLHVVDDYDCNVELGNYFLEADEPVRDCPLALGKAVLTDFQVLAERIQNDQLDLRELLDDLLQLLVQ